MSQEIREKIQQEALGAVLSCRKAGLHVSMGVGKTYIGLQYIDKIGGKVLVVAPKITIFDSWKNDARKFNLEHLLNNITFTTYISFTITIYGEAGAGKTTLGNTAKNAIVFDFDEGHQRSKLSSDVFERVNYKEIATESKLRALLTAVRVRTSLAHLTKWIQSEPSKRYKNKIDNYVLKPYSKLSLGEFIDLEYYFSRI